MYTHALSRLRWVTDASKVHSTLRMAGNNLTGAVLGRKVSSRPARYLALYGEPAQQLGLTYARAVRSFAAES